MLCAGFMKYGVSVCGPIRSKRPDKFGIKIEIQIINGDKEAEVMAEEMLKVFEKGMRFLT